MTAVRATTIWLAVIGLVVCYIGTALPYGWEGKSIANEMLRPSVDWIVLSALACVVGALTCRFHAWIAHAFVVAFAFVPLYRFGATMMPVFYGKEFEPYVDMTEAPALVHLLLHDKPLGMQVSLVLDGLLVVALAYWVSYRLWRALLEASASRRFAGTLLLVLQLVILAAWVDQERVPGSPSRMLQTSRYGQAVDHVVAVVTQGSWRIDAIVEERLFATKDELERRKQVFADLEGADVYVLFLESYGRGVLSTRARARYSSWLQRYEATLSKGGIYAKTGWMRPSVVGGGSAFAHLELLSGIKCENRRVFDALLESPIRTLPRMLRDRGYLAVNVEPAMPREWPEAAVMGFEKELFRSFFPYAGWKYAWGDMPDQYALAYAQREVLQPSDRPVFVQYVSVSSHAPFAATPKYYPDWTGCADRSFEEAPENDIGITWMNYSGHPRIDEAYESAMRYSLDVSFGFASQLKRRSIVFVLGDHQPPIPFDSEPDRLLDVPFHVLSNDKKLLDKFGGPELVDGLVPDFGGTSFEARRFLMYFLAAYGG